MTIRLSGGELGRRIREHRELLGLTQEEVARDLGIPRSAVSEIEGGKRELSALEFFELARLFGVAVEDLAGEGQSSQRGESLMFRAEGLDAGARAALNRFLEWCRTYRWLEERLGEVPIDEIRSVRRAGGSYGQAHRLADEERKRLDLGSTPGRVLLDMLEQRLGVKVLAAPLGDDLSGASVLSAEFGPAILVNSNHSGGRQVFTLAHEYYHLLTGSGHGGAANVCSVLGPAAAARGKPRQEQLADQFAGRLLLPPDHFVERLQRLQRDDGSIDRLDLIEVARYFGVSVQALFVGLARLKLVPWDLAKAAYADAELQDAIAAAGGEHVPEPKRFRRLAMKAYRAGELTKARLAELLDKPLGEVDAAIDRQTKGDDGRGVRIALPR